MDFSHKVVLITGASSGVGAACALKFAKLSAKLALIGRNVDKLKKIGLLCQKISGGLSPLLVTADISSDDDVERIVNETIAHHGKVDVLVNNAGISVMGGIHAGMEAYDRIMATNLRGTYLLTSRLIPQLIETKGNVVNISSILATKPCPTMTPYCMSKAALDMFTKCLALEMGPKGLRVNSINAGPVKTDIFRRAGMTEEDIEKLYAVLESSTPLRKVLVGDDVAELVLFLTSDKASNITGSLYVIDCGVSLGEELGLREEA